MFVALWEYEVKPGDEERFENAYGLHGDWARLFQSATHCREMRLVRDTLRPGVYLTMDFWTSREAYEEFLQKHRREYEEIDSAGEQLAVKERRIGWFEMVEGTKDGL
jgi:heme-degrading monooxygenase HmoA